MKRISQKRITPAALPVLVNTPFASEAIRALRAPLLAAFDIYKGNVLYGIVEESHAAREEVLTWYRALLDKEIWALTEIPAGIRAYLGGAYET